MTKRSVKVLVGLSFLVACSQYATAQTAAEQKRAGDARALQLEKEISQDTARGRLGSAAAKEREYNELMTKEYKDPPAPRGSIQREPRERKEPTVREPREPAARPEPRERPPVGPGSRL